MICFSVLGLLAGALGLTGCYVTTSGGLHVRARTNMAPPAPRVVHYDHRPGYVYIQGRWVLKGNDWQWEDGSWVAERPGYVYEQGYWDYSGGRHVWVSGRWMRSRPGYVWSGGDWDHEGGRQVWRRGQWVQNRPGHVWVQGRWDHRKGRRVWTRGTWAPQGRVRARVGRDRR
jgi:hypothetical protein